MNNALDRLVNKKKPTVPPRIDVVEEILPIPSEPKEEIAQLTQYPIKNLSQDSKTSLSQDNKTSLSQDNNTEHLSWSPSYVEEMILRQFAILSVLIGRSMIPCGSCVTTRELPKKHYWRRPIFT